MPSTIIVEPNPSGHRFQAVAHVAEVARRTGEVLLLTSRDAVDTNAYAVHLGSLDLRTELAFDEPHPPTRQMAEAIAAVCRREKVSTAVLMDADQSLKRWWYVAPRAFRGLPFRPRVVFMLTRYPAKLRATDWVGWKLRIPKATLAVAAMATGSLHRVAGFAGRDDTTRGWLVKRTRDPDICTAHSRDRALLRAELDLPADRRLAGIFGVISVRKNADVIWEALARRDIQADLVLAGKLAPEVAEWAASLSEADHGRLIVRDVFLSNESLDKHVAAVDVVPLAMTLNGPSGIMGKAIAAGVPVVTAGSEVRARELVAADAGELADLNAESLGAAIQRVFNRDPDRPRHSKVPPATPEEFAETLLGVDGRGRVVGRRQRSRVL